jgi:hypothetical protein
VVYDLPRHWLWNIGIVGLEYGRDQTGIYRVLGFAIDWKTNILHTVLATIGLGYGLASSDLDFEDVKETLRDLSKSPQDVPIPKVEEII